METNPKFCYHSQFVPHQSVCSLVDRLIFVVGFWCKNEEIMKITQQELFNFIKDEKPNVSTYPSLPHMIKVITKKLGIKENEELRKLIKYQMKILVLEWYFRTKCHCNIVREKKTKKTKTLYLKLPVVPIHNFCFIKNIT